jgi:hypothetical protein
LEHIQFLVDADGHKRSVVLDLATWEELLTLLEDLEDAAEIRRLRELGEEVISWEQARGELQTAGIDV